MKIENNIPESNDTSKLIQQLQLLQAQLTSLQEAEYKELSTYLNDTAVQTLTALHIELSLLLSDSPELLQSPLPEALALIRELAQGLTAVARKLRPVELDTVGLNAALQQASEEFAERTGLVVHYAGHNLPADWSVLPETASITLYRFMQEAFANIDKHAQASEVEVKLQADGQVVSLTIEDNGNGFATTGEITLENHPGLGLLHMMTRFQQLNGRVSIQSTLGQGSLLTAVFPWPTA